MLRFFSLHLAVCLFAQVLCGQEALPVFDAGKDVAKGDWLVDPVDAKATLYETSEGCLVLANGLVSRTFTLAPNVACVGLDEMTCSISYLRSVRPEASVTLDGHRFDVGGLTGQPVQSYLLKEWIPGLKADPSAFKFTNYRLEAVKERFPWKKNLNWMPRDVDWPVPGKELIFTYKLDETGQGLEYLKDVEVEVHYELYDGLPVFCKWISVINHSGKEVTVDAFKSEILAAAEAESSVDDKSDWLKPNITVDTDYNFGGMSDDFAYSKSIVWKADSLYNSQVNYGLQTPCLLEASPQAGPAQHIGPGCRFESHRVWELLNDGWDRERKSLAYRRMIRSIAPWVTENPVLMHVRSSDDAAVRKAVDQCAETGFEMVIMTFGSGFNAEDDSQENISRMKSLADYADSKGIALGGYSLLASRSIDKENDVVLPEGQKPRFGNSPCIGSVWGQKYFKELYNLFSVTGLSVLEHDGSYPGDFCWSTVHPGHEGLEDSQWNQFRVITDFYKWCRSRGIYLNVPDIYFLNGSSKTGMGYREVNWSLPRAQQEIIERQNIFDGTWNKTPSMGWMFVPLVEYHGGGEAATIEPLKDHLPHYGQRLANLFGSGVQACYRGPELYDSPKTLALVKKWVSFYKLHREVLDGDIIHVRRPDGRDYDAMLHVNPQGEEKGLLMVYNPLDEPIERSLRLSLYYAGLKRNVMVSERDRKPLKMKLDQGCCLTLDVTVPAKSQTWFVFE